MTKQKNNKKIQILFLSFFNLRGVKEYIQYNNLPKSEYTVFFKFFISKVHASKCISPKTKMEHK